MNFQALTGANKDIWQYSNSGQINGISGDTLSEIAAKYDTTYLKLAQINNISNPDLIYPGQVIQIG
ncbi:LysM peptidoglycan-binding domain-containing protein [Clostridium sp. C105KSO13]|uniref:LysM peptidoglycan-binding domain-containing protein n=1 Tax=Clostridium sp. C105KSO13 TaxID=1776045 RepID=UPI000B7EF14C